MDRRIRHRRRTGALWLLLLAVVSVLAPVWADTYVCPMAKQALAKSKSCCAKTEVARHGATPGDSQVKPPCDCPKLSWSADATDQARELRAGSDQTTALTAVLARYRPIESTESVVVRPDRDRTTRGSAAPIWRLHQSILC